MNNLFPDDSSVYDGLERSAILSDDKVYRYSLGRRYSQGGDGRTVAFVMLNL